MKYWILLVALLSLLIGCGGGGGGGGTTGGTTQVLTGRVINVVTTGPVSPAPGINVVTGQSTTASTSDGFFLLDVPVTTSAVNVVAAGFGTWTFGFPPSSSDLDLGDLWVGPEKVTVAGTVRDSASNLPIANAQVAFAGRSGVTDASGNFSLAEVAYASGNLTGFWGIEGRLQADGFFASGFTANGISATAGVVQLGNITLVNSGSNTPPTSPYNVYGIVKKAGVAVSGQVAVLKGGSLYRQVSAGTDGRYYVWLPVGTYVLRATSGSSTGANVNANLTQSNQVINQDLTVP